MCAHARLPRPPLTLSSPPAVPIPTTLVNAAGKSPSADDASFVAPSANLVGAVTLGPSSSVWYASLLRGDEAPVVVGELSSVGDRAVVVGSTIGAGSHVGAGAIVQHATIGDGASVGVGCKIFKGASIGARAALAAGSVLPAGASVPDGEEWAGSPAKKVGTNSDDDAAGLAAHGALTAELAALHADEAWKDMGLVEQEKGDYKREKGRTAEYIQTMREDPGWVPMPTLGEKLSEIGAREQYYVPK